MTDEVDIVMETVIRAGPELIRRFLKANPKHWLTGHARIVDPYRLTARPDETFRQTACLLTCAAIRALWHHRRELSKDGGLPFDMSCEPLNICNIDRHDEWQWRVGLTVAEALQHFSLFELKFYEKDDYFHCMMVFVSADRNRVTLMQSYYDRYPMRVTLLCDRQLSALMSLTDNDLSSLPLLTGVENHLAKGRLSIGIFTPTL